MDQRHVTVRNSRKAVLVSQEDQVLRFTSGVFFNDALTTLLHHVSFLLADRYHAAG
jgi:hypothetical protein